MAVKQSLTLTEVSYDSLANTSEVKIVWTSKQTSGSYNDYTETAKYYITANGVKEEFSVKYTLPASTTKTILSKTITVPHADDGTGSVTVNTWMNTGISAGVVKLSKTLTLTPIARASTIGATDAYIESTAIVAVNQKSTDYTHSIAFSFVGMSGYIDANGKISETEVKHTAVNIPFSIPASFYAQIPNQPSAVCTLTCKTYLKDTQIGEDQTATFTVTADPIRCMPIIFGDVVDINGDTLKLTGDDEILVCYRSTARCTAEVTAKNGASISSIKVNGVDCKNGLEIPNVAVSQFVFEATDSRGYASMHDVKRTMIPYIPLTVNASAARTDPTSGNAKLTVKGLYYPAGFGAAVNSLAITYTLGGAEPVAIPFTLKDTGYEAEIIISKLDYLSSYYIDVTVEDAVTKLVQTAKVNPGIPVFDWGKDDFCFNVPVNLKAGCEIKKNGATAYAPSGYGLGASTSETSDLNTETKCGWKAFTSGCANAPFGYGVVMIMNRYGSQITQIAINPYMAGQGQIAIRHRYQDVWREWEYLNPPMVANTEYRTTERVHGKALYKKADADGNISYRLDGETAWYPEGAGVAKLWENASSTSNFAAQTISLDLSKYQMVAIAYRYNTTDDYRKIYFGNVGSAMALDVVSTSGYLGWRSATVSTTGISFSTATFNKNEGVVGYVIPVAIYGIKGVGA